GDLVVLGIGIDQSDPGFARLWIDHVIEVFRLEHAILNGHHRAGAAFEQVLGGAVAQVARVLHVEGDRIGAAQLVTDVFVHDGGLDTERGEALAHLLLHQLSEVDLRQANVVVLVPLDIGVLFELLLVEVFHEPFGEHGDAVGAAVAQALDHGARHDVHDLAELDGRAAELLGDDGDGGARSLADAERQVPRGATHGDHEVPAVGGARVYEQVFDDVDADVARRLIPERGNALG